MDENYGQTPNSITGRKTPKRRDFPAQGGEQTMFSRAQGAASKLRLIPQPGEGDFGADEPKSKTVKRTKPTRPKRPDTSTGSKKETMASPGEERGMSISQALLKGAAMVPESGVSGTLRGILGGASVGMDIGTALDKYNRRKREETAANAAMKMGGSGG